MQRQSNQEEYFRQIDFIFYREREIRDAIYEARHSSRVDGAAIIAGKGNVTDPTAAQAIKNMTPLNAVRLSGGEIVQYPERWLTVIEKTYEWCKTHADSRYEIASRRYKGEDYRRTCMELGISQGIYSRNLIFVRMYAALHAVQQGLIRV